MSITVKDLAKMIDHSLLHPTMTDAAIREGCELAMRYHVASVCLKPYAVRAAAELLRDSDVLVGSVIGFPHGNSTAAIKTAETLQACADGAVEIDMVINIGKALGGDLDYVEDEIRQINDAATANGAIVKVIFENDYLDDTLIEKLCLVCNAVGPAFVKTSTGYGFVRRPDGAYTYAGATVPHLRLMRRTVDARIQVKAAGGIRTLRDLLYVRSLGVTRIGASATGAILEEAEAVLDGGGTLEAVTPTAADIGGGY